MDLPLRRKGSALPQSLLPSDDRMGSQEYCPRYARRSFGVVLVLLLWKTMLEKATMLPAGTSAMRPGSLPK